MRAAAPRSAHANTATRWLTSNAEANALRGCHALLSDRTQRGSRKTGNRNPRVGSTPRRRCGQRAASRTMCTCIAE
eukprot:694424-Prymnesium_polylepis.1